MAAARQNDYANYGDGGNEAHLMELVEIFPNLSLRQLRMHTNLFPADTPFDFLVDSLIDVGPDGGTPPQEEEEEAEKEFQDAAAGGTQVDLDPLVEVKPCVGALQNVPKGEVSPETSPDVKPPQTLPKLRSGSMRRPRFLTKPQSCSQGRYVKKTPTLRHGAPKGNERLGPPVPQGVYFFGQDSPNSSGCARGFTPQRKRSESETEDDELELARYLDRAYWQTRNAPGAKPAAVGATPGQGQAPSAPANLALPTTHLPKTTARRHGAPKGNERLGTPVPQGVYFFGQDSPKSSGCARGFTPQRKGHPQTPDPKDSEEEVTDSEGEFTDSEDSFCSIVELEVPERESPEVVTISDSSASPGTPQPARVPAAEDVPLRLAEVFPDVPLDELTTLCEGHPGHSLEQLVAEFLLLQEAKEAAELPDPSLNRSGIENSEHDVWELEDREAEDLNVVDDGAVADVLAGEEIPDEPEDLEMIERYQDLLLMFPTADPDFLRERAAALTAATMQDFVEETLETGTYPKEEEYRARERIRRLKTKYIDRFDAAAFLATFPDPAGHFGSRKAVVSADRTEKAVAYLALRYGSRAPEDLAALLKRNEGNLSRTCAEAGAGNSTTAWLDVFVDNEDMLQEIAFIEHREELELVRRRTAESKQVAVIEAQCKKETLTCGCCYGDTFLLNDMATCLDGHLFCKECIARSAEVLIGQGKSEFPCLEDCGKEFSVRTLKSVLKRSVFLRMEQRRQFEEVNAAEIPDLETCPACDFSAIPRPDDIVFACLNPDCQLVTCRKCREPSHIPLRCDELPEKEEHTRIRTQLEDRMTQALVRECWSCKKKFVKSDGCNKMQCTCGALMCYLCRQPVKDYSHFNGPGGDALQKCELFSNNEKLHVDAVRDEAVKARAEVAAANPNLELKYDPTLLLP